MTWSESLLRQVREHRAADPLEEEHRQAFIELLERASDPASRTHFEPGHVTASVYVVDPATSRLLLHHHRRLDRWLQMGGHIEADETPQQAALREGAEESGLGDLELLTDSIVDLDVHFIPGSEKKGEPGHHHFDVRYVATTAAPAAIALAAAESKGLEWLELDRAEALMNEAAATRVILKIRRMLEREARS